MKIKRIIPDKERSDSLLKTSEKTIKFVKNIKITKDNAGIIFGNYYESLIEILHSYSFSKGFDIKDHFSFTKFIYQEFESKRYSEIFERCRKLRNGLIYYGKDIPKSVAMNQIKKIKELIEFIKSRL